MPSSHQHGISNSGTRRKAGRKWRHIANAKLRQRKPAKAKRLPKALRMTHQKLGQGVKWVDRDPIPNKLPL